MKTNCLKRHRHGNAIRMRKAATGRAPPSPSQILLEEARRNRRRQDIEVIAAPSSSSSSSSSAAPEASASAPLNMNRRNSFEDFAALDTAIAGMLQKVQHMAQVLQNAGNGSPSTSTSSIEQSIFLSETFDAIQPLMLELQQEVNQEAQLLSSTPNIPSEQLLVETALKLLEHGEQCLTMRLESFRSERITTWQEMNSKLKVFSIQERQVMSYLRHLKSQTPSALPIFPRHLDTSNTYILMGDTSVFFFAHDFICRGQVPPPSRRPSKSEESNGEGSTFWCEASDTDDETD